MAAEIKKINAKLKIKLDSCMMNIHVLRIGG